MEWSSIAINSKQDDRESVTSGLQSLAPADLEGRFGSGRKERLQRSSGIPRFALSESITSPVSLIL